MAFEIERDKKKCKKMVFLMQQKKKRITDGEIKNLQNYRLLLK